MKFELTTEFVPGGDQPTAIADLVKGITSRSGGKAPIETDTPV